jgi:hypothetical protein
MVSTESSALRGINLDRPAVATTAAPLTLSLAVRDPESIAELLKHADGPEQQEFALGALRLGILAIRQASGSIDTRALRSEAQHMLEQVGALLDGNARDLLSRVGSSLQEYFDPRNGKVADRLNRLVAHDGELSALLARHFDGDASTLAQTLCRHVGEHSPLLQMVSPGQKDGLIAKLQGCVEATLEEQRKHILGQFSLDDKQSALSRLVKDVTDSNGKLRSDLSADLSKVQREFSLDNEQGALTRLVSRVEKAQRAITSEFSADNEQSALCKLTRLLEDTKSTIHDSLTLDNEQSPLARLSRELKQVIGELARSSRDFQAEVHATLETFKARREEAARTTLHGCAFETAVAEVLRRDCQQAGDLFEEVGTTTGLIKLCKVGDHVITLGPDCSAAGSKVVVECKEDQSYTVARACAEMERARQNRGAQVGIFVFSKTCAPDGTAPLVRYGKDVLVVWGADDPATDVLLRAAVSVARALAVRERAACDRTRSDLDGMTRAVARVEKACNSLGEVITWASNIKRDSDKILRSIEPAKVDLEEQIRDLRDHIDQLREETVTA